MDELRLALRRLWKRPATTLASIVTLAGSIGAAVVMWTVMNALLVKPLPVSDPETLATVVTVRGETVRDSFVYNVYRDLHTNHPFASLAAWGEWGARLKDRSGEHPGVIQFVTPNYFATLGVTLAAGRTFATDDDRAGAPATAIVSDKYWRTVFKRDRSALGTTITVNQTPVTIVGVAPRNFRGLDLTSSPDLFMPLHVVEDVNPITNFLQQTRNAGMSPTAWVTFVGRLPDRQAANRVTQQLAALPEWSHTGPVTRQLEPLDLSALPRTDRNAVTRFTLMLAITVGLLLLAGCASSALLLLARTEERRIEFATCLALGAAKARLVRGVAIEGAITAAAGAILAVPAGLWLFSLLDTYSLPGGVPLRDLLIDIRGQGVAIAAAGGLLATLLVTVAVASGGLSLEIMDALRAQSSTLRSRTRARAVLIAVQVAIAVVLLAGTTLFVRSLSRAVHVNTGRNASLVVNASFPLRGYGYEPSAIRTFHMQAIERLSGNGSVASAAVVANMSSMSRGGRMVIDNTARPLPAALTFIGLEGGYFETAGLPVLNGRPFGAEDTANSPAVAIVSESFGRFLATDGTPLGHRVRMPMSRAGRPAVEATVVGVVPDLITNVRQLQPYTMYVPMSQHAGFATPNTIVVRAVNDGEAVKREILAVGRAIDPTITPRILTLKDTLYDQMRPQQLGATVLGALGVIAALLTMLGLYVIAESTAAQRRRELAIRAALGATRRNLRELLIRDNLRIATIGALAGLAVVYAGAGTIGSFLFGVESFDPLTLTVVPSSVIIVAVLVALGPALRASRRDLARVLRDA